MGSVSSKSESYSLEYESESSNSGAENGNLERMNCLNEKENIIINRVWIVKKSINLTDRHVDLFHLGLDFRKILFLKKINLIRPLKNVFNIKNQFNSNFKHWAIILELSNNSYVNIQFGRNGFSLEEFNRTDIEGENLFNSILCTWGEDGTPFSFCYLGKANFKYKYLKKILKKIKEKEEKRFKENGKTYYNVLFKNCQHFVCYIEKIIFNYKLPLHIFSFYLDEFYNHFFPDINLSELKQKYERELYKKNEKLFKLNVEKIKSIKKNSRSLFGFKARDIEKIKKEVEELFHMEFDDYLD